MSEDTIEVETKFAGDDEIHARTTVSEGTDKIVITIEDAIPTADLEALIDEWQKRGVEDPYGMTWYKPAEELEELIEIHNDE